MQGKSRDVINVDETAAFTIKTWLFYKQWHKSGKGGHKETWKVPCSEKKNFKFRQLQQ